MFENTLRTLNQLNGKSTYTMAVLPDADGFWDKECPNPDCLSKFKVNADDWKNNFSDEVVYCPFCRHEAPSRSWWTTEQIEQAKEQAIQSVKAQIGQALQSDARDFNRRAPKGFISMNMKFSGSTYAPNLPAASLEEMEQKITCEKCKSRYAVIGSAFYCPCCGHNSARLTFFNTLEKVKAKIGNLDIINRAISQYSKDEAARTCASLVESSIPDLVIALQRLCECIYPDIEGSKQTKRNIFQRLDDSNALWKELLGQGYEDWIGHENYARLKKCFQQRHVLQHQDGIVDQDYIDRCGDTSYKVGQHLVIKAKDVLGYVEIVSSIGSHLLALTDGEYKSEVSPDE